MRLLFGFLTLLAAMADQRPPVFACDRLAITAAERPRYNSLLGKLRSAVRESQETEKGYRFRIDQGVHTLTDTAEWISMERRCCPFLSFELRMAPAGKDFWLLVEGPVGVKSFLNSELKFQPR